MKKAISKEKSSINVLTLKYFICEIYDIKLRYADKYYTQLKKIGYINIHYGKSNAVVVLSEKALNMLKIDEEDVTEDFYTEYLKICEEVKNEISKK